MSQITIISILDKIRSICKDCSFIPMPERVSSEQALGNLEGYLRALECIRQEFIKHRSVEEEYSKLQQLLQREQTEIRKRIGVENQLKLYTDTLKAQLEDLEKEKVDLLENTKVYIKQLKKTNERLFLELNMEVNKNKQINSLSQEKSPSKSREKASASKVSKFNRSQSHNKSKRERSIKEIIKTEYIDQSRHKKLKTHAKREVHETISDTEAQPMAAMQNSKTYQVTRINSSSKKGHQDSKKKNNHIYSNPNFYSFFDTSKKKLKKEDKSMFIKSPGKGEKKKQVISRVQNASKCLWKDKRLNRSVYSVLSLQQNSNQKETI